MDDAITAEEGDGNDQRREPFAIKKPMSADEQGQLIQATWNVTNALWMQGTMNILIRNVVT